MKNKNISDPIVLEIFRVEQGKQATDTKKRRLAGVDLLQNTMLGYEPDLYHPEVLIKTSATAPLIRNKIDELEIEEWQNTTALFAEVRNLDSDTKSRLGSLPPMHRAISVDKRSGKLIGVAITGDDIPLDVVTDILEKAFYRKPLKDPMIFHQEPVSYSNPARRFSTADEHTKELMGAIENYILQAIHSRKEEQQLPTPLVNKATQPESGSDHGQPQLPMIKRRKTKPPPTIHMNSTAKETVPIPLDVQPSMPQQTIQPVKMNEPTSPEGQEISKGAAEKSEPANPNPVGQEPDSEKWFVSSGSLNWKERKSRDRNIVNLTERIIGLSKSKNTPPRGMIVSYLASLSTTQYEFLENLIDCFTEKTVTDKEATPKEEEKHPGAKTPENDEKNLQATPTIEKKIIDVPPKKIASTNQQDESMKEPIEKREEPVMIESAITNEALLLDPELEEFKNIPEEEKALHLKILDYQKKHNVSYDRAASVVL